MKKKSDLNLTLEQIIDAGEKFIVATKEVSSCCEIMINAIKQLKEVFPQVSNEPKIEKPVKVIETKETKTYTKEDVRGVLAQKASSGYREEVKELLTKYNATQLKQVKPEDYASLMEEATVIGND